MTNPTERDDFEAWAVKTHGKLALLDSDAGSMWSAWQARAALASPQPATVEPVEATIKRFLQWLIKPLDVKPSGCSDEDWDAYISLTCGYRPATPQQPAQPATVDAEKRPMTLNEFFDEAEQIGLTGAVFAKQLAACPEFADCLPAAQSAVAEEEAIELALRSAIAEFGPERLARAIAHSELRAAQPAGVVIAEHDYPILQAFHTKHALGALSAPSCLNCGKSTRGVGIGVQHMELPAIVICKNCKDATPQQPAQPAGVVCEWSEDDDDWATGCGESFSFVEGGPEENDFKHCCYCGKTLTVKP